MSDSSREFAVGCEKELGRKDDSQKPKHNHCHNDVSDYGTIDVYVICDLYVKDNSGYIQHAVKKLLCCGERGVKDNVKDLQEAIDTIQRKIEMLQWGVGLIEVKK